MLLHIGAFQLDADSQRSSPWHQLAPRTRLLCALLFVFATALTPQGRWWTWAIYALGLVILMGLSRITLPILLRRVAAEFTFIAVVLLGTLFRQGGTVLWRWQGLQITTVGLMVLGSVATKALLCLLMLNLLVLTTSVPALLHALAALRTPPLLVAIFAAMYRYIGVLVEEFNTMRRAAASRNLTSGSRQQRLVVGNMIGGLFIRTYERGERIHQAMLARGYTGLPPVAEVTTAGRQDRIALTLMTLLLLLGQAVYLWF
ncbi:cobalt ECF transporter T component CbiQ [Leptolyngbya sp. NK1-12]|uniref:Cobalt ECF transporter T component CbiQ n=1 Tax=Leptolyngbya sp. NK1-12 TaxID=2547451 RepID=A0AA97AFJ1_9CYAN|nr:cobalt ECF transporter T component CbiQ [Leptolyngbya sp. NK1-12]WNZ23235.1 cobalt ECF transporter T component CbiQ [Leptolyngbya sp. NK1-12]